MPNIHEITPNQDRIDELTRELEHAIKLIIGDAGKELGGFAVIGWTMGGRCITTYDAGYGLVHRGLVPSLIHDAIQRHITLDMMSEGNVSEPIPPKDSA